MHSAITIAQSLSDKLYLIVDVNKYGDPQLDNVKNMKDLGTSGPKWHVSMKLLSSGLREVFRRGSGKIVRTCVDGRHQGKCSFQTKGLCTYALTETVTTSTRHAQFQAK